MPDGGGFLPSFRKGLTRNPPLTVSQWADAHRYLTAKGASEPGRWRTSRVPFLREILDCLSSQHPCREVVFKKSTQVGGTEVGLNWIGYAMDHAPGPMLAVLPTVEVGQRWSKQRLASMIEASPQLSKLIAPSASRDGGNTMTMKEFAGDGMLIVGGANSAASLASMPIKYLLLDEIDKYPAEVDEEGDPVDLAKKRTTTFPRRKIFKISSPTIKSLSRIEKDWLESDQRSYHVACPHCQTRQPLIWENVTWPEGEPEKAKYRCGECGALIDEHHKTAMLADGVWVPKFPEREIVGFHINALYTPLGLGDTWAQHAADYLRVKNDPARFKVFYGSVLGECFEDESETLDWQQIKERAEPYALRTVPVGCLFICAGVDVQKDRIEVQLRGFGEGSRRWTLDWHYIPGDPTRGEVWEKLDEYLAQPLTNAFGISMKIAATGIDSGYLTQEVYNFCRIRKHRNIFVIKGGHGFSQQLLKRPSKKDFKRNGGVVKGGAEVYEVSVNTGKQQLYARLASDGKHPASHRLEHFSADLPEDYFMQLTAEVFDPRKRTYVKLKDRRNEALDTANYAEAIAHHPVVRVQAMRESDWKKLRDVFEPAGRQQQDLFAAPLPANAANAANKTPAAPAPQVPHETTAKPRIGKRKGGFVQGWKNK